MTTFCRTLSHDLVGIANAAEAVDIHHLWVLRAMQAHGPELVHLLWRILGNEQDVCDVYQTTFLRLSHVQGGRKPEHVKAYLLRTASNAAISLLRSRASERRRCTEAQVEDRIERSPDVELDQRQLVDDLRYYIAQLPEHLREVVTLRDLGELSYSRIARLLGITAGTARVYRCKAVTLLAAWMNDHERP